MVHWIAFDDETADMVVNRFKRGGVEIREDDNPLDAALRLGRRSMLVLPATTPGRVLLAKLDVRTAWDALLAKRAAVASASPIAAATAAANAIGKKAPSPDNFTRSAKSWWHRRNA